MGSPALRLPVLAFVASVAGVCFINSIRGEFVIDDFSAIANNQDLRPETPWPTLFRNDFWGRRVDVQLSHKSYRPLTVATFRVNFLWSGLDLWWLHATNIGLHSTASLVVLWTAKSVLGVSSVVSVAAALLFASHPVHAEAVAGLVGRAEILCTIFYCGGLGMYEKSRRQPLCLVVVFLMGAAALLSKEIGVTLPLACLWMDLWKQPGQHHRNRFSVIRTIAALMMVTSYVGMSIYVRGGLEAPHFSFVDNPLTIQTLKVRVLTASYICARYMKLLFVPTNLSTDYSFAAIALVMDLHDVRILGVIAMVLTIISGVAQCSSSGTRQAILGCCGGLCLIPLLPASHLLIPIGTVIAERLLYLPSFGFCVLLASLNNNLLKHRPIVRHVVFAIVLALFSGKSMLRSADWRSGSSLASTAHRAYPRSAKSLLGIGIQRRTEGDASGAKKFFIEALKVYPEYSDAEAWLGRLAWERGDLEPALRHLQKADEINSVRPETLLFLGLTLAQLEREPEAVVVLNRARVVAPGHAEVARDLGILLHRQGKARESVSHLRAALMLMTARITDAGKVDHTRLCLATATLAMGTWESHQEAKSLLMQIRDKGSLPAVQMLLHHKRPCTAVPSSATASAKKSACRKIQADLPVRL